MKPLYVLTVDASTHVPIGGLRVAITNKHTFHFTKLEDRIATMDWALAQGWEVTTDVLFTTDGLTAMRYVRKSVTTMCEYYHLPVPDMAEPAADPDQGA